MSAPNNKELNAELFAYRMDQQDRILNDILAQAKATNGRVTKAESEILEIKRVAVTWTGIFSNWKVLLGILIAILSTSAGSEIIKSVIHSLSK